MSSGNYMVFRAKFLEEQKKMDGDQYDRKEAEQLAKVKWSKMGKDTKSKYAPAKKQEQKSKSVIKDKKSTKQSTVKDVKKSVSKGKKSDTKAKSVSKGKSTGKPQKEEEEKKSTRSKSGIKSKKGEDLLFGHVETKDTHCWDVPLKMYMNGSEMETTLREQMNGLKCALIVNVASKCGHTKRHYTELVQLHEKYASKGFQIFAFPCNDFGS